MDANDPEIPAAALGRADGTTPRTFRFPDSEWERIEACAEARGQSAAEFVRLAVRAALDGGPATGGAADRLAPLIERAFRYSYMLATRMRDDMVAEGRDDEVEALVRAARALQDELTGASGG